MTVHFPDLEPSAEYPSDDLAIAEARLAPWDPTDVRNPYVIELVLSRMPTPDEEDLLNQATIVGYRNTLHYGIGYAYLKIQRAAVRVEEERDDIVATLKWATKHGRERHEDRQEARASAVRALSRISWA